MRNSDLDNKKVIEKKTIKTKIDNLLLSDYFLSYKKNY